MQILQMLRSSLEEEGYAIQAASDGQMAIQIAMNSKPDLIIMDVNMPMYNGFKTLQALRGMKETQLIPVILLTGAQSDAVYPVVEAHQRVIFIKKPVDLEQINSTVRRILNEDPKA